MKPITTAVLAGGQSKRMGRDKAEILRQGETLLARTARTAQQAGLLVVIIGREMPLDWPLADVEFFSDVLPGQGPLGGVITALENTSGPILALACDMPKLTAEALHWLTSQEQGIHGVTATNAGQWEPLFSIYLPTVLPLARMRLAEGRRSLHGLIEAGDFAVAPAPPEVRAALFNVNTPEELNQLSL